MARPASERTLAIRKLFKRSKGRITYSEARPKLEELGYEVPAEGTEEHAKDMNKFNVTKAKWKLNHMGTDSQKPQERKAKVAVADKPTVSHRPKYGKVAAHKNGKVHKVLPKHGKNRFAAQPDINVALQFVTTNGGVAACREKMETLRAEANQIENHVNAVLALHETLAKAVA